ncbi:biotin--[acetyl-CoA-carboxylase] ligase [Pseudonocardia sp.]|jgi:BirA family biotin operon repressor/biotin-[acetyl-CoA-carboxylase] ligase|uniref:biotin--[acetyl-CoA-carboxylase] ligase n=1 Tax=Pseudonocardia sp. TaxID=60912 RepID=UPI002603EFCA|nr:biotin--[acetyl-CoA-carboxylase] ligase [Pseudonocardia sp.]MCW2721371.1 Biotin--[acetyl-CoA-carboxylase] ligase [Pseudonocardia sp.]MDT7618698.1 BirA family transcriptional regulator [Pseudonocardiales bacterium]
MNRTTRPLDPEELRAALLGTWAQVDVVATTGSTNADLLAAAAAGAPDRTVLVAEHQQAGRGRLTRSWVSPPGSGLTVSVLLRPTGVPASRLGWLPLLTGMALLDTVRDLGVATAGLKWPNDLLLGTGQRKAAGILAEVADPVRPAVVVGIGLNVADAPPDQAGATSLAAEGVDVDRADVLVALLGRLAEREQAWRGGRGDPDAGRLRADYRAGCATLGAEVRVELPGGTVHTGIAEDVDRDGRLLLLDPAGHRKAVAAGDVVHVRPTDHGSA